MGGFLVQKVIQGSPTYLWRVAGNEAGISKKEFDTYYSGLSIGFAISASKVWQLKNPIVLDELKQRWENFTPPQGYRYINLQEIDENFLPLNFNKKIRESEDRKIL